MDNKQGGRKIYTKLLKKRWANSYSAKGKFGKENRGLQFAHPARERILASAERLDGKQPAGHPEITRASLDPAIKPRSINSLALQQAALGLPGHPGQDSVLRCFGRDLSIALRLFNNRDDRHSGAQRRTRNDCAGEPRCNLCSGGFVQPSSGSGSGVVPAKPLQQSRRCSKCCSREVRRAR